jgi:hypothetical protein
MHGHIAFVPEVLPIAPPPIAGEFTSFWLLHAAFANGITLAQFGKSKAEAVNAVRTPPMRPRYNGRSTWKDASSAKNIR